MPRFTKDARELVDRSIESMTLAIELFNRPSELARQHAVLILLHHAFEMLLKAALLRRTGRIHDKQSRFTYSFDKCLAAAQERKILTPDEVTTLSILDAQRDQAVHFYSEASEEILYVHAQSSATLFAKVLSAEFDISLGERIPSRVLPVSVRPPRDMVVLLTEELRLVDSLLEGGAHRGAQAAARLRSVLAFVTASKERSQRVTQDEVRSAVKKRRQGETWEVIFPEIAQLRLSTEGQGIPVSMRIAKDGEGAFRIAKEGEAVVGTLVKMEVNIWDKFNLGLRTLAEKVGLSEPRTLALIYELKVQDDNESYHELRRGRTLHKGYSKKALDDVRAAVARGAADEAWEKHRKRLAGRSKKGKT